MKPRLWAICLAAIAIVVAVMVKNFVQERPEANVKRPDESENRISRPQKPTALKSKAKSEKPVATRDVAVRTDAPDPDADWLASLSARERALAERLRTAIDNEDLAAIKALAKDTRNAQDDELRSRMVDALAWFDDKVLVELTPFIGDSNSEIAKAAFNAWDSAVDMVDDEKFRVEAATMVMQTLTDEDSLRLAATKLEACEDSKAALKAAVEIAANDGNPAAAAVAREVYEFITGEEWPGAPLARVKTITFKPDGESEDESPQPE